MTDLTPSTPVANPSPKLPITAAFFEAGLRLYSRVAPTERGGYRLARFVRGFRPRDRWRDTFTTPLDLSLDLDLGTYPDCCMAYGLYELDTTRLVLRYLRLGDHFVDVGANIGYFTLIAASRVGSNGRVDAFEPEPANHQRLVDHLQANGLADRVNVHHLAASDQKGQAQIHTYEGDPHFNHGCASLFEHPWDNPHSTPVPTDRLDAVLAGTTPRMIKMDVEGAEAGVVAGMTGLLTGPAPPMILGEHNPSQSQFASTDSSLWIRRVVEAQPAYRVYVVGVRLRPIQPTAAAFDRLGQVNVLLRADN